MTTFVHVDFGNPPSPERQRQRASKMPQKKKGARTQRPPPPLTSDYDTDPPGDNNPFAATETVPVVQTNKELNILVLKRWYPDIERILTIAHFAVVYSCNPETQEWEKCDIQGSLFVCRLSATLGGVTFKVIILNRKSMENFELDLVSTDSIEVTDDFIICSSEEDDGDGAAAPHIFGIWMYKEAGGAEVRDNVVRCIMDCAREAEQHVSIPGNQGVQNGQSFDPYESDPYAAQRKNDLVMAPYYQNFHPTATSSTGQSIDVASLFVKPQHQPQDQIPTQGGNAYVADTRVSGLVPTRESAIPESQQQQSSHDQKQNVLLDLFKNPGRG